MVRKPSAVVKHTPGNKFVRAGTKTVPAGTATLMQLVRSMLELVRNVAGKETCSWWPVIQKIPAGRSEKLLDPVKIQLLNNLPRLVKNPAGKKSSLRPVRNPFGKESTWSIHPPDENTARACKKSCWRKILELMRSEQVVKNCLSW